jgi:hypothetical protein
MDLNVFDPKYVQSLQVASLQRMASEQNALRVQRFQQASADWITGNIRNRDMGLAPTEKPAIPKKIVVDPETGDWSDGAFDNLLQPELPAPVVVKSGSIANPAAAQPDRLDQALYCIGIAVDKLDQILGVLKAQK